MQQTVGQDRTLPNTLELRPIVSRARGVVQDLDQVDKSADRDEHVAAVLRFRLALKMGILAWIAYVGLAWLIDRFAYPGSLGYLVVLHACGLVVTCAAYLRIRNRVPSHLEFAILDVVAYTWAGLIISLMCLRTGGLTSVYPPGISIVLVLRLATMGQRWRRALPLIGPALMYPLVQLVAALFSPAIAAQMRDSRALVVFAGNMTFIAGTATFTIVAGNAIWELRRQLFAARNLGRYRLVRRIGMGGMGEVWSAYHPAMQRAVAVKVLSQQRRMNPQAIARFEREIQATSELTHPNTVRVFDCGTTVDGLWYYVMELLDGENVTDLVARSGPLPAERAVFLIRQAARALSEAHQRGIIHRDIKPDNLFVTCLGGERDFVKVLDFGIARLLADDRSLTGTGVVGTPGYIAPEVMEGAEASARSDIYALGAVLYFMISGHAPFEAGEVKNPPAPPSAKLGRPLPPKLEAIAMRCLARDPQARFATTREMIDALDSSLQLAPRSETTI